MDVNALNKIISSSGISQTGQSGTSPGSGFADLLEQASKDALKMGHEADRQSLAAIQGKADLTQVIGAVSAAEITLQSIVAVRDKVISAYQEILRMPI